MSVDVELSELTRAVNHLVDAVRDGLNDVCRTLDELNETLGTILEELDESIVDEDEKKEAS